MYISSFHISDFGVFSNISVEDLSPGLIVFYGRNEAGKSTCLEFLRSMLTGPARNRPDSCETAESLAGEGTLALRHTLPDGGENEILLTRRTGTCSDFLSLRERDGKNVDKGFLSALLADIDGDLYRAIFGFSLAELQNFASLGADDVRSALYGASFGAGLRSPGEALEKLKKYGESIFRPEDGKCALNALLLELERQRKRISDLAADSERHNALTLELDENRLKLGLLRRQKQDREKEKHALEKRIGAWRLWEEWRALGLRLDQIEGSGFPENGMEHMARLQNAHENLETGLASLTEKLARLAARKENELFNSDILSILPDLRRLAEQKSGYRQAVSQSAGLEQAVRRAEDDLGRGLARLGPGWNCGRIRKTDRSLFAREDLERLAREMDAATNAYQAAIDGLNRANADVESASVALASANSELEEIYVPDIILNGKVRDALRRDMDRLNDSRRITPGRQAALDSAVTAFQRACGQLGFDSAAQAADMDGAPDDSERRADENCRRLDCLLSRQEEALQLSAEFGARLVESKNIARAVNQAEENAETLRKKIDDMRERNRRQGGPSREDLDARAAALRTLRAGAANMETERERLGEIESRIETDTLPAPSKSIFLLLMGCLLIAAGGAMLLAHWIFSLPEITLWTVRIPLNPLYGYLVGTAGVLSLAGGLPRTGPEARQHASALEKLRGRRDACSQRLREIEAQNLQLCKTLGTDNYDPITLDATEVLLQREREQCFHEERSRQELNDARQELALLRSRIAALCSEGREKEAEVQKCRRRWHELLEGLGITHIPSAESAATFFARAETARVAHDAVDRARKELNDLWQEMHALEANISAVPAVAERLAASSGETGLQDAVQKTLDDCIEADAARERILRAQDNLQNRRTELERVQNRQAEANAELKKAEKRQEASLKAWKEVLGNLDLDTQLEPATVRQAFELMEDCLRTESQLQKARQDLEQCRAERDALEKPLKNLLEKTGQEAQLDESGNPDWLGTLTDLLETGEAAFRAREENERLAAQIADQQDEIRALHASLETNEAQIKALVEQAGAADTEDFHRMGRLHLEEQNTARRRQEVEDMLRLSAEPLAFEEFIDSFSSGNLADQENRLHEIGQELETIEHDEQETASACARLDAEAKCLSNGAELTRMRQEEANLIGRMELLANDWRKNALACALISEAKKRFEQERQPEVIRAASEIFSDITGGQWLGLSASIEDNALLAAGPEGKAVAPELLSRGTREQAYLALRLAYIRSRSKHAQTLPVIMDEALVNFDPDRTRRTAGAFVRLARDIPGQQVFYFTCQPHMVETLRSADPQAHIFNIENGKIMSA